MLAADGFSEVLSAWGNVGLGEGITSCAIALGEEEMEEESPCYGHRVPNPVVISHPPFSSQP
eukprot:8195880-Lingulodinium_polyedra.AAC.1